MSWIIFFLLLALVFAGYEYAAESFFYKEVSVMSPANVPIFQFKAVIPAAGLLLFLQGIAQVCRCIICIKTGEWPAHIEDIEEMETVLLHQQEDAARASAAASKREGNNS